MNKQSKMWLIKRRTGLGLKLFAKQLKLPFWRVRRFYAGHDGVELSSEARTKIDTDFREQIQHQPLTWKERILMLQREIGPEDMNAFLGSRSNVYNIANGHSIRTNETALKRLVPFSKTLLSDDLIDEQLDN